jgi:hypothetical protein
MELRGKGNCRYRFDRILPSATPDRAVGSSPRDPAELDAEVSRCSVPGGRDLKTAIAKPGK